MRNSTDPFVHRQRQQQLIEHIQTLLEDERLRLDTLTGRRPIPTMGRHIETTDSEVDLIRRMSQLGKPDRQLQERMPVGLGLSVTLWRPRWLIARRTVGELRVICLSPTEALLTGQMPKPVSLPELRELLRKLPTPAVPQTLVILSTSGFAVEAHELVERSASRTLILVEPTDTGGWQVSGPSETQALVELFDPESAQQKRRRVRQAVADCQADLLTGALTAPRIAGLTQLPLAVVEAELRAYAADTPGLAAKRLAGQIALFRQAGQAPVANGGSDMPFLQRVRALFSRKGEDEKKMALLSERRAMLSQQRDLVYEQMASLEKREQQLRHDFAAAPAEPAKRRLTSQLLQVRKEQDRRAQVAQVLNQQIDILGTHLHNIDLARQGQTAQLPSADELAADAAKAEEVLADLQATAEAAGPVAAVSTLSAEEQALYEELQQQASAAAAQPTAAPPAAQPQAQPATQPRPAQAEPG